MYINLYWYNFPITLSFLLGLMAATLNLHERISLSASECRDHSCIEKKRERSATINIQIGCVPYEKLISKRNTMSSKKNEMKLK